MGRKLIIGLLTANVPVALLYFTTEINDAFIFLILSAIFTTSVVLLIAKDEILKKLGFDNKEIILKGVVWLVSPVMFVWIILFGLSGWEMTKDLGHSDKFLLGLILGVLPGLGIIYFYLGKSTRGQKSTRTQFKFYRKVNNLTITLFLSIILLISIYSKDKLPSPSWFIENHPDVYSLLLGLVITFIFFSILTGLFLAVIKKEHLEV